MAIIIQPIFGRWVGFRLMLPERPRAPALAARPVGPGQVNPNEDVYETQEAGRCQLRDGTWDTGALSAPENSAAGSLLD